MIWCEQRFDNAKSCLCRANCPVVLSCAVCLLPLLRSDRQYGGNLRGGKNSGTVRDQIHVEKEKRRKVVHNNTYCTQLPMFERKHTAQHDTAQQRRVRHRTARLALRYAALLGYI